MNLHAIVSPYIGAVNPPLPCMIQVSDGYGQDANYEPVPKYKTPIPVTVQLQSMSSKDLQHVQGMNINGEMRAAYITGDFLESTIREENKGGDLITLPDGTLWLSVYALENWTVTSGWMKAVLVRQNPQ